MHYYTKEWYLKSRCTGLYLNLQHCSEKEASSTDYYDKLFAIMTDDVRFECEQIKNTSYDVFAEDRAEDEAVLKAEYERWQSSHRPDEAEFIAMKRLSDTITNLRVILPEEIIKQIPDIRIFALHRADEIVTALVTEYAEECRRFLLETDARFEDEYCCRTEPVPDEIWQEYGFKGGRIKKIIRSGTDITIHIDNCGSGSDVTAVHLTDCSVERLDEGLDGAEWIYNELYLVNGSYELCALCRNGNKFPEFIIHTPSVQFDYDR